MDIVIPLCGKGERFAQAGYAFPKPFILVGGKPILQHAIHRLHLGPNDAVWILGRPSMNDLFNKLNERSPSVKWVSVAEETRGAAETVALGLEALRAHPAGIHGDRPVLIVDGDSFYRNDIVSIFRDVRAPAVAVFPVGPDDPPIFSYSSVDGTSEVECVTAIAEKEPISSWANSGAYFFPSRVELAHLAETVLGRGETAMTRGEFYMTTLYQHLLREGGQVVAQKIDRSAVVALGTPAQVQTYLSKVRGWLFDLDGTLVRTEDAYFNAWKTILNEYGAVLTRELFDGHVSGRSDMDVVRALFPSLATADLAVELGRRKDAYMALHVDQVTLVPGAVAFCQSIRSAGDLVAIVTNSNRATAEALLDHNGIPYDLLIVGSECARPKPYPDPYQLAMQVLGIPCDRVHIFEDSPSGLLSANASSPARLVGIVGTQTTEVLLAQGCTHVWSCFTDKEMADLTSEVPGHSPLRRLETCIGHSLRRSHPDLLPVHVEPFKLKGGYIADVFRVRLGDRTSILKTITPPTTMLSRMAEALELHQREFYFYEAISPFAPITTPRSLQVVRDNKTLAPVGILLEELAAPEYRQGVDLAKEPMDVTLRVVERCAAFHAWSWGKDAAAHFSALRKHDNALFKPFWGDFVTERWPLFETRWKRILTAEQLTLLSGVAASFPAIQTQMAREPLCICHGDVKAPNLFFRASDMEPVFLDWQYVAYGKGVADIVFLVIESFEPPLAKQWGPALLEYYYAKLQEHGVRDYSRAAFAHDTALAACHFPFFVAIWFGTTPTEDLIDVNFPFFFLQRYVAFLEERKCDIHAAISFAQGTAAGSKVNGHSGGPLGA